MLKMKDVVVHYGAVEALKGISLDVEKGSITTLIGGNGAGKSTCLRAISGIIPVTRGEIWFEDRRINGLSPNKIVKMGITHVPEGKRLFLDMSVADNLLTGAFLRKDTARIQKDVERISDYFPILARARNRPASSLSGGEQQMLAIGRGLMANPRLLMLDEPSLGLSPILTQEVASIIKTISEQEGLTIMLIEQNASIALSLASKGYVMETGNITMEGNAKELQDNEHVRKAYLGIT
jgi:branched-chain amino acid transport system ATP-binding protein